MRLHNLIEPMLARSVGRLPDGPPGYYLFEPKWDGFRCIAIVNAERRVHLQSRRGAQLNQSFPEVAWAVYEHLPAGTVIDGEIVRWSPHGTLDFGALQRRVTAGRRAEELSRSEPCHLVVWDVLRVRGQDVTALPLTERRRVLEDLFAPVPTASPLALTMQTAERGEALGWYHSLPLAGIEGLVIKPAGSRYEFSARGWLKLKQRITAEALVGGVTGTWARPSGLLLGRYDAHGRLRVVGRTTKLNTAASEEITPLLRPAGTDHPWPQPLPPGWAGSPYAMREPIAYLRAEPDLVVEVLADVAVDHGRWRHGVRYIRSRAELHPTQLPLAEDLDVPHGEGGPDEAASCL